MRAWIVCAWIVCICIVVGAGMLVAVPTSGRNGEIVWTNGNNPDHGCETKTNFDEPRVPFEYEEHERRQFRALDAEGRRLFAELESKHRELMSLEGKLADQQILIVLEDLPFQRSNDGMFHELRTAVVRHDGTALDCVVVDSFTRSHDRPERWTRRLARVRIDGASRTAGAAATNEDANAGLAIVFETVQPDRRHAVSLDDMDGPVRLRAVRRMLAYIRDVIFVLDLKLAQLRPES